jgi:hypothetical protein
MRLDTSLRTAHRSSGLGDIEFLPVTQQEGFPLTPWQLRHLRFDGKQDLSPRHGVGRTLGRE